MSDMKRFNALKKVRAKPMSRQEYNDLRGWDLPADEDGSDKGYLVEDINAPANTDGYSGYVSWTPNDIFEDQFYEADDRQVQVGECTAPKDPDRELTDEEIKRLAETGSLCDCADLTQFGGDCPIEEGDDFDFGSAVYLLKIGKKVARAGWNGKDMFLYYVPAASYPMQRNSLKTMVGIFPDDMVPYGAYIAMKTAQDNVVPWLASQTDVLAEDWQLA